MAEPTSKTTRSKRGMRRSHHAIKDFLFATCSNCGATIRPHHVCHTCGYYKDRLYKALIKEPKEKKKSQEKQEQEQN